MRIPRRVAAVARALVVLLALPLGAGAQVVTPEIERGLNWLQAQVRTDRTVIGEDQSIAERLQVRCELRATMLAFNRTLQTMPCVVPAASTVAEILVRTGANSGPAIPASYWLADGGVAPDVGYQGSSVIDTAWALNATGTTTEQAVGAISYLYGYQFPSGGFGASWSGPESVAATGLIGRALAQRKPLLAGDQPAQLAAAATWVLGEAQAPGRWASLYETALAHLFLVVESPDPVRDAATYEYFVANQSANGSWADDPFLTALVLRAAATRSLPRVNESGYRLRVIDSVTRLPVPGALVGNLVNTGSNGVATLLVSPAANVSIPISKTGYLSRTLNTSVTIGVITDLGDIELTLAANAILVTGDVVNDSTGQPVPGATIRVFANGSPMTTGTSDAVGHFGLPVTGTAGAYRVEVSSSGFLTSVAEFTAVLGRTYEVDVRLRPTAANSDGAFRGTVTDAANGAPLINVSVSWKGASGATRSTLTAADGTYAMTGLARETGELTFAKFLYASRLVGGVAPSTPETVVNVQMVSGTQTTAQVSGFVRDSATGMPLAGARIDIVNFFTGATAAVLTSDASGQFSVSGLTFTTYRWTATLAGYMTLTGQFPVGTNPFVQLHVSLLKAVGSVTGKAVDKASGVAIAGATARIGTTEAQSDAAGVFTLGSFDAGLYNLEVTAAGYRTGTFSVSVVSGLQTDIGRAELVALAGTNVAEVFGTVTAKVGGAPISGASVSVVGADPLNGTATDAAGAFGLRDVALGTRQIRVVAAGYQPATFTMSLTEAIRYRLDATLVAADANEINLTAATNAPSYGAYAPGTVTSTFVVAAGVSQAGHMELTMFDSSGRVVKTLPEAGTNPVMQVTLTPNTPTFALPFNTGNLAPGAYRIQVSVYDAAATSGNSTRALLASANANFSIAETRKIEAVTVIPLPEYINVGVPTATGYRVEITNRSNVAVDLDIDLRLQGPPAQPVGLVTQRVPVRADEVFKSVDLSAGTIAFTPNGVYQAVATVVGVTPPPIAARAITVVPATRIEVQKKLEPAVIPPFTDQKIRIDIRVKGVQQ